MKRLFQLILEIPLYILFGIGCIYANLAGPYVVGKILVLYTIVMLSLFALDALSRTLIDPKKRSIFSKQLKHITINYVLPFFMIQVKEVTVVTKKKKAKRYSSS